MTAGRARHRGRAGRRGLFQVVRRVRLEDGRRVLFELHQGAGMQGRDLCPGGWQGAG
ncbi:hypothetical protein [uncultured Thiodictyon sp.]|uniref:hypothetical protein n=1 Tax=uncultured Thiodictyon sp. TaxID=1846217 RepID=UPI0025FE2831|nr:hypothetical protein [uncultured Thiodictyon sp.]